MRLWGMTAGGVLVPVTVDDDGHLQIDALTITAGNNLIGRVDARDGNKIWSYLEVISEQKSDLDIGAGYNTLTGTLCPANRVWQLEQVSARYIGTSPTSIVMYCNIGGVNIVIFTQNTPTSGIWYPKQFTLTMDSGDYIWMQVNGGTATDDIYFNYSGRSMQI